jgi:pimeloyl-ACP methyl ester carboxylesterase
VGISDTQVIYFKCSNHCPFIEAAEIFWRAVGDFLRAQKA